MPHLARIPLAGPFDLAEAAAFAAGSPGLRLSAGDGVLLLASALDGTWEPVGAEVRQDGETLSVAVAAPSGVDPGAVVAQVAAMLSADVDGTPLDAVAARDPVAAGLVARHPGLRPVLFHTPYEAAVWTLLGHRTSMREAAAVRSRLADAFGDRVGVSGHHLAAFPGPAALAAGLEAGSVRVRPLAAERLRALCDAALAGGLDRAGLRARGPEATGAALRALPGIGPFAAELIRVRGVGDPDALPEHEPRVRAAAAAAYGFAEADAEAYAAAAESWRPLRAWVALLLRVWQGEGAPPLT